MRRSLLALSVVLAACQPVRPAEAPTLLPLRTLRLYETGVGYFERSGELGQATTLPVPAGHLDDALKSLVVLSAGGQTRVGGVSFTSSVSKGMARAMSGLPVDGDAPLSYRDVLVSLKGAKVELVRPGGDIRGRLIEVLGSEHVARQGASSDGAQAGDAPASAKAHEQDAAAAARDDLAVLVLTDRGEVQKVPVADVARIRPLDPDFPSRLGATLDALSSRSTLVDRSLRLFGELRGSVTFGYVTETPTWRPSYRVVIDRAGQGGRLQGWALLHNDTEEDWNGVRLELVNGRPDAFLYPMAAPRYMKRTLVHPDDALSTVPQLWRETVDSMWGDQIGDSFGAGGLGLSGVGEGGGGRGEGIGLGGIGTIGHGAGVGTSGGSGPSELLGVGNLASVAKSEGVESGALFRYTLAEPLALAAHGSALVPFLDARIEATPISWAEDTAPGVVRTGVRLVNSTGQTVPAGPVAFFADGGFAGDSAIDRLKPSEERLITFGADLDVKITIYPGAGRDDLKRVVFAKESLEEHFLRTTDRRLDIEVRSPLPRDLFLSVDILSNATLTGADAVDFDAPRGHPVAVFHLAPQKEVTRSLTSVEGREKSTRFDAITAKTLSNLAGRTSLSDADRAGLGAAAIRAVELEKGVKALAEARAEVAEIEKDLPRLNEHLKAVGGEKGGAGDSGLLVKRVLAAEDHLTAARRKVEGLDRERAARRDALHKALEALTGASAGK